MTIKNYTEQGGDKWVIGGTLEIIDGAELTIKGAPLTRAAGQKESSSTTIADLKADFNALLAKLKTAGLMDKNHG